MKKLGVNIIAAFIFGVLAASATYYLTVKNRIDDLNRMVINNQSAISEARKDLSGIIVLIDDIKNRNSHFDKAISEAENEIDNLRKEEVKIGEISLPPVGQWKELLEIEPPALVRVEAYTSDNNYFQPWTIYLWKASSEKDAGMYIVPNGDSHQHSSAVKWEITKDGKLRVSKTKYNTTRNLFINKIITYTGKVSLLVSNG